MNKTEELEKLSKAIKEAEMHLSSIECNISQIDKEIDVLSPRKIELEQNIEFHKKSNTVPIAHEYKKTRSELTRVKSRLGFISVERGKAHQACKDIEKIIEQFKKKHAELSKTSENNVLRVLFGGFRGKK